MQYETRFSGGFGSSLTDLGKKMLIAYLAIYIVELILIHWLHVDVISGLGLWPLYGEKFHVWQIFAHPFLHDPFSPLGFLLDCIVFYFFAGSIEEVFGTRDFLKLFYISAAGGALFGLLLSGIPGFDLPFFGMTPSILAMIVVFGFLNPEATILLMFIFPLKAKYLSYGTILITFLTFLAKANPYGAYHLGGIFFGYLYFRGPKNVFDYHGIHLRYIQWQYERKKKSRFKVYDGGKNKKKDDGPTYH